MSTTMSSRILRSSAFALLVGALFTQGACDTQGFGKVKAGPRLQVSIKDAATVTGSRTQPLALKIDDPQPFTVTVRALDADGNVDRSFNGFVRMSSKPGAIERIQANDADGRSLKLTAGESPEVEIRVANAYGTTYIVADDLGYAPADPLGSPPPSCSNGVDDDGDGTIDFPADEGCAYANDDSETGSSYAQGASEPIYYRLPRIADVRGLKCDAGGRCSGNGKTPYPKEAILLDTGYNELDNTYAFDMVVTRISSDGFYATDTKDTRGGFNSIFAFNFNSPPRMRVCDRLKSFAGTASEFFGFTQVSYPTWTLEEWDPQLRPCLVPEPVVLGPLETDPTQLLPLSGSLVRAATVATDNLKVFVSANFGPGDMACSLGTPDKCSEKEGGTFSPKPDATNCDFNKDGKIDFTSGVPEQRCSDACTADAACTEYSNFVARSTFRLTITDGNNAAAIQADATASAEFHPLDLKGQQIKAFTGTLHFFSGGSQFTIEARCKDDIVVDLNAPPLPSDKACVFPRTIKEENPQ